MKENTNGQAVQGKPADQQTKGNDGTQPNPKNQVMTPEKIKAPIEAKGNEQIGDAKRQQENKDSQNNLVGQQKEKNNADVSDSKKDINSSGKTRTPIENKNDAQVEEADEEIGDDEEDQEENERSEDRETSINEPRKGMPISFDRK